MAGSHRRSGRRVGRYAANIFWVLFGVLMMFTFTGIFAGTALHIALTWAAIAAFGSVAVALWIFDERRDNR